MAASRKYRPQTPTEELLNSITHGIGILLGFIGLWAMLIKSYQSGSIIMAVCSVVFGASLIFLYSSSTWYHGTRNLRLKVALNKLDHAAIYVLIAGTYTPFALITLNGNWGWLLFGIIWGLALFGLLSKVFFMSKVYRLSAYLYLAMGWIIVFYIKPLSANISSEGLFWIFAGGFFYSLGVVFYLWRKQLFAHSIFHILVLAGSVCHFWAIFKYVLQ